MLSKKYALINFLFYVGRLGILCPDGDAFAGGEQDAAHIRQTISRLRERQGDYIQARNATRAENPAASTAALDAEIQRLNQQIAALEAQLNELNGAIAITRTG